MNWVDFVILGIAGASLLWSLRHGLIMELVYFVSIVIGLLLAFLFYPWLGSALSEILGGKKYAVKVAFGCIFLVSAGIVLVLGVLFHKFIYFLQLGVFDRILGGIFGLLKAALIISVSVVMVTGLYGEDRPEYLQDSKLCSPIVSRTTDIMKKIPPIFEDFVEDYGNDAVRWIRENAGQESQ